MTSIPGPASVVVEVAEEPADNDNEAIANGDTVINIIE